MPPRLLRLASHRPRELRLVHLGAPLDAELLGLRVELVARRAVAGALAAAAARRRALRRGFRAGPRLARARLLLVDGPGGDLLGATLGRAAALGRLLDLLVLARALRALLHASWRHGDLRRRETWRSGTRPVRHLASCNVRLMFCLYLALIAAGLAFYIVVGLTHH